MDILGFLLGVKTTAYIHMALKLGMPGALLILPNLPT
jgi:hypothetical protein